jgi:predicted enzyme related to lactoylglutathione lyase
MQVNQLLINITSEQPEVLARFYRDVVGLPREEMGEWSFNAGGTPFLIDGHSEVHGSAKEPARVLINFMVDDLEAEQSRLEAQGVQFVRTAGREDWGGIISTFLDPDGNYIQLMEYRPEQ